MVAVGIKTYKARMNKQLLDQAGYQRKSETDNLLHTWIITCFPSYISNTKKKEGHPIEDRSENIVELNRLGIEGCKKFTSFNFRVTRLQLVNITRNKSNKKKYTLLRLLQIAEQFF